LASNYIETELHGRLLVGYSTICLENHDEPGYR